MLQHLLRMKRGLTKGLEVAVILIMAALLVDVLWGVVSRYVLGAQSRWTEELATFLLIWLSLLGASAAFASRSHLGVDYFVGLLHTEARRLVGVVAHLAVIAFASCVMLGGGFILVTRTLAGGQVSPALGLQIGHVYLAVPISGLFIILFAAESILEILGNKEIQNPTAPPEELLD